MKHIHKFHSTSTMGLSTHEQCGCGMYRPIPKAVNNGGILGRIVSRDGDLLKVEFPFKDTLETYKLSDLVWDEKNNWYNTKGELK